MKNLFRFLMRSSPGSFILAVVAGLAGGAGGVGLLALIPAALDSGPGRRWTLGRWFLGLCILTILARFLAQSAMIRIAQRSVARLIHKLCETILDLPLRELEDGDPSRLTVVLTEDVIVLTNALAGMPSLFVNAAVFLGCFAYLGYLSPAVLLATAIFAVPAILSHAFVAGRGRGLMVRAREEQEALVGHCRALVEGFRELKLHRERREAFLAEAILATTERVRRRNVAGHTWFAGVNGWGQWLYFGYLGFVVFALPAFVTIEPSTVGAAALTVVFAMSPLDALLNWLPILARAGASMQRIEALGLTLAGAERAEIDSAIPARPASRLASPIVLREVTYSYPRADDEGFTLGPLNLTVEPGEILFLVGGNGSGKTTLVKLLSGLYANEGGEVWFDRQAIGPAHREAYRQLFTVVFADGFLFPTLFGLDAPDLDEKATALLGELGLESLVSVKDGAFSTTSLSQGQKKRLALLAACLEDRPILVLDEWASYQDSRFKKIFYCEILPALKASGKTLIVISHDEDFYFVADRLVHLSSGMVDRSETPGDRGPDAAAPRFRPPALTP